MKFGWGLIAASALVAGCGLVGGNDNDNSGDGGGGVIGPVGGSGSDGGDGGTGGSVAGTGGDDGGTGGGTPYTEECLQTVDIQTMDVFSVVNAVSGVGSVSGAPVDGFGDGYHLLMVEFYQFSGPQNPGTFDLGAAPNNNYETCDNCVRVLVDIGDNGPATQYFPVSGTLTVDVADAAGNGRSRGSLTNVELLEVEIDPYSYRSAPVGQGRCVHVSEITWDLTSPTE